MSFLLVLSQTIDSIAVSGNRWTSTSYILRYCGVKRGDTVNDSLIARVKRRLWELGLFRGVDVTLEGKILKINVKETWYVYPMPYLSVSSTEFAYGAGLMLTNFRGMGENTYVLITRGSHHIFTLGWSTPKHRMVQNILSVEGGREYYISYMYRMPMYRYFFDFNFEGRMEKGWKFGFELSANSVYSDSTHLIYAGDRDNFISSSAYVYRDARDWKNYPRKGYLLKGGLTSYLGDFAAWVFGASCESYFTTGKITFVPYISFWRIFGNLPVYLQLPLIGASDVVRGSIPDRRVVGNIRSVLSLEIRHLTLPTFPSPLSRFVEGGASTVLFIDMGRVDTSYAKVGGLGVLLYTPFGTFTGLVGYGTGGFNFFFGESLRIP